MSQSSPRVPASALHRLNGISEIRGFWRTNTTPVYFFGPTAFNLLGIDRWVRNFSYVAYFDSWDGGHPRVFSPKHKPYVRFESSEEINNYLLRDPEVQAFIAARGGRPKVAMVFFDEETERICAELGYDMVLPSDALRRAPGLQDRDNGPRQRGRCPQRAERARGGRLVGARWSALLPMRDLAPISSCRLPTAIPGKTTFFVASESDWASHAEDIVGHQAKVMKRINNKAAAVEAVLTRHGTVVGPFMTDLTGYPELTPYPGGWCGNDLFPEALSEEHRAKAIELVRRLGGRLGQEGYKGFFEVDVLIDLDTDEVYLGELNPRISGVSSMTNVTAGAYADIPLFLFHLLEYMDVDYVIDVAGDQRAVARPGRRRCLGATDHERAQRLGRAYPQRPAHRDLPARCRTGS